IGDFVTDVASELPLQAISELIGVPQEDRGKIFSWSNQMIGYDDRDPNSPGEENVGEIAAAEILGYSLAMAEERRGCPRDDIVTKLISAEIDGNQLSDDEFGFFVLMLAVAGNETIRTSGSCSSPNARTRRRTRSSAGPPRSRCSSAPRPRTRPWAARRSRRASASGCSTVRPTSTRRSSTSPSGSTSCATRTRTSATAAWAPTTAWAPTWPSWRSS